jgi:hypothetical protein
MAAGLGFKTFTTGEVLTAADTNGYLMQGILVFASEAARNAAITSPQEGQFAYTKDNNSLWYYTGSAWAASGATGDIEGVTAGTGISGGGTSGTVTITNSMATEIAAKADLIVGTGSATFDNLTVGANGTVLTADSTVSPTGLKWATPASGGGMTLLATHTLSGSTSTISGISGSYTDLVLICTNGVNSANAGAKIYLNGNTTSTDYYTAQINFISPSLDGGYSNNPDAFQVSTGSSYNDSTYFYIHIPRYSQTENKIVMLRNLNRGSRIFFSNLLFASTAAITSVGFSVSSGSWSSGTVYVYGVK